MGWCERGEGRGTGPYGYFFFLTSSPIQTKQSDNERHKRSVNREQRALWPVKHDV